MIISTNGKPVERFGEIGEERGFTVLASSHAFKILTSSLYSDRVMAVVRESYTNSFDSHLLSKREMGLIEVHIPNQFEPWFGIKDFGTGLDNDFMMNRYTCLFDSTKNDSNLECGGFGIGRCGGLCLYGFIYGKFSIRWNSEKL